MSGWRDFDWQLIHAGPQSPALHMALDEVITDEVAAGRRAPTLRVWEWASPAVVMPESTTRVPAFLPCTRETPPTAIGSARAALSSALR